MPDLQTKNFETLVREQVTAIQGASNQTLIDVTVGSILRAVVEAYAAVALWLQGLILKVLAVTRAATSTGADLDSWVLDYGLVRLPATAAAGQATFSRFTPATQAVVPVAALIQSADGTQQYAVTLDTANTAYNAGFGGYVMGAGVASITVPISANGAGARGNAAIGGINTLGQAISGVDTVTNLAALTNGAEAESDVALRARFIRYVASLSKATKSAVAYALGSIEAGVTNTLVENENYDGSPHLGYFYVIVDDGSGEPSTTFLARAYAAIDAVRPVGISFNVFAPSTLTANVVLQVAAQPGYDATAIATIVQVEITNYINALSLGVSLSWSRLIQVAYDASPGVGNVSALTINNGAADLTASPKQVIKAANVAVAALT